MAGTLRRVSRAQNWTYVCRARFVSGRFSRPKVLWLQSLPAGNYQPVRSCSSMEAYHVLASEQSSFVRSTGPTEHWVGIVDDDASIRCSLARVFRMDGIRVETFGSAEEFLERTVAGKPDCVVLDVHLG